ncbi:putative endopeptidase precursor [Nocardioides dokdonensis FR1436]|uniref:Putative endopeptidase n=1 Tax=Nocardioides dokdonensis FR1436 TaxID=1300347 RepID=A0A1A9GNM8_9ACTN|nr:NlpC/P60 family protein [Nocardioides dokdonensis]ANH39081.1 putative endopeptidase precursor [Nocardioides dokdonensis FR1436]
MLHGRKRLTTAFAGALLIGAVAFVPTSPAQAEPDIDDVQARVEKLYHEAEQASERHNDARIELEELERELKAVRADQELQDAQMSSVRDQVRDSIVRTYQGQSLSAVGQVVLSDDPSAFLAQMSTLSAYDGLQDQLFETYSTEVKALDIRRQATASQAAELADVEARLAKEKATIDEKVDEAESMLSRLETEAREAVVSRDDSRTEEPAPVSVPASGRAAAAVQYAMAQVGKSYVYGAAGPSSFDCSGLTMMAWRQAGVSLPHSSSAQYSGGTKVSTSSLQPGDLVFYYSPISHVGMYIGNGQIVHAANPSTGVQITGVNTMPLVGAVRPG